MQAMNSKGERLVAEILVLLALLIFFLCYLFGTTKVDIFQVSFSFASLTFLINGCLSSFGLCLSLAKDIISLRVVFFFFNFIFFFAIPFCQYVLSDKWLFLHSSEEVAGFIVYANIVITTWMLFFSLGYKKRHKRDISDAEKSHFSVRLISLTPATLIVIILFLFVVQSVGFKSIFLRSDAALVTSLGGWGPVGLIGEYFSRPFAFFVALLSFIYASSSKDNKYLVYFLSFAASSAALLLNLPTATARFYAFAILTGLLIIATRNSKIRSSYTYFFVLFFSLFGSNWINFSRRSDEVVEGGFDTSFFFDGHFDAYEILIHALRYVSLNGVDFGRQLLGAVLFWVPRSMWEDKPVGTGAFIADTFIRLDYMVLNTNLSSPLVEELYFAFWLPGVLIGAFALGYFCKYLDLGYQKHLKIKKQRNVLPFYTSLYPILIGLMLFIMRGDALSSFAYSSGIAFAFFMASFLLLKKVNRH